MTTDLRQVVKRPFLCAENEAMRMNVEYIEEVEGASDFSIYKADDDKRLVFGWASIAMTVDGEPLEDLQKDVIDEDDLEEAAYQYVLNFRDTGEEHMPGMRKKGRLVESCVFTKEKQRAMGLKENALPVGWWIGFYIDDDNTWQRIKDGTYRMFSIEGKAERVPVKKGADVDYLEEVEKFNPYHGSDGRFTSANGASSMTIRTRSKLSQRAADKAIARAKEKYEKEQQKPKSRFSGNGSKKPKEKEQKKKTRPSKKKTEQIVRDYIKQQVDVDIDDYRDDYTRRFDGARWVNLDWAGMPRTVRQKIQSATVPKYSKVRLEATGATMMGVFPDYNKIDKSARNIESIIEVRGAKVRKMNEHHDSATGRFTFAPRWNEK